MAKTLYCGSYAYLGGHPQVPMPYIPLFRIAQVRVTTEAIVYGCWFWILPLTFKQMFSIPVDSVQGVEVLGSTSTRRNDFVGEVQEGINILSQAVFGEDLVVAISMEVNGASHQVQFQTWPLLAWTREKNAKHFAEVVQALIASQSGQVT